MKMTRRETLSAALILPGMLLLCTDQLPAAIAGVALLGAGAGALNWVKSEQSSAKSGANAPEARLVCAYRSLARGRNAAANFLRL